MSATIHIQKKPNVRLGIYIKNTKKGIEIVDIDVYNGNLLRRGDIITHLNEKHYKSAKDASKFIISSSSFDMKLLKQEIALYSPLLDF